MNISLLKIISTLLLLATKMTLAFSSHITPFKYKDVPSNYEVPASAILRVNRPNQDAPKITCYISSPDATSFPLVVLCGGSSTKSSISSAVHLHRYFLKECQDLKAGLITIEQWGVESSQINTDEWFTHYTRSQRLFDHQSVLEHLFNHSIEGWNGKLIFIGVSEGGPLVTSLTERYNHATLATINWSGAGDLGWSDELWAFAQALVKQNPPCPHGSKLSDCLECGELKHILSAKELYKQHMKSMLLKPRFDKDFFGMSHLYHADALTYPRTDYSKLAKPYLVVTGAQDTLIDSSDTFVEKAKKSGCPITYFRINDMDHYVRKRPDIIKASFNWLEDILAEDH